MYPGRWNDKGVPALYASMDVATAALEVLSHLPKDVIPCGFSVMRIRVSLTDTVIFSSIPDKRDFARVYMDSTGKTRALEPNDSAYYSPYIHIFREFASAEGAFTPGSEIRDPILGSFAVFVPSAIVPAYNAVLFPNMRGFTEAVGIESVEPFDFHSALFPPTAAVASE
jgi:RES domain